MLHIKHRNLSLKKGGLLDYLKNVMSSFERLKVLPLAFLNGQSLQAREGGNKLPFEYLESFDEDDDDHW